MTDLYATSGHYAGSCGFRLMPSDDFDSREATATATPRADGHAWTLDYTWTHPTDGEQSGFLLVGSADDDGVVTAAWSDSWHQKPHLAVLTGHETLDGASVAMTYAGTWGWTITVATHDDGLSLSMHNEIPDDEVEQAELSPTEAGPYLVMDLVVTSTDA